MTRNASIIKAKRVRDDEFYTRIDSIEEELSHYPGDMFRGKVVYSNCDSDWSAFVKYFRANGDRLGIKDFIHSSDDFSSQRNLATLKHADFVLSNPPFSLFRKYFTALAWSGCSFIVIGNAISPGYHIVSDHFLSGKVWIGASGFVRHFDRPDGSAAAVNAAWFTNVEHDMRSRTIPLESDYDPDQYPRYDQYDAIEVNSIRKIPKDYDGLMGLPVTFLSRHNPEQFDLVDMCSHLSVCGSPLFQRVIIRNAVGDGVMRSSIPPMSVQSSFDMG